MTKLREKTREDLTAEIAAFLRLALTSEEARAYLKKRAGSGKSE